MNPLSPFAYLLRHKIRWIAATALIAITVSGIFLFIGLAEQTYIRPAYAVSQYLDKFSLVQPDLENMLRPEVLDRIAGHPAVDRIIPQANIRIQIPNIGGSYFPFRIIGIGKEDAAVILSRCGVKVMDGSLPRPGSNEVVLSEEITKSLGLKIGDTFDQIKNEKTYRNLEEPLKISGVLSGDVRLGLMSYEFLICNPVSKFKANGAIVLSKTGKDTEVREFLKREIRNAYTRVYTNQSRMEDVERDQTLLYQLGIPVVMILCISAALVVASINRIHFRQRMPEFGTLYAIGRDLPWLARKLARESAIPAFFGWAAGLAAAMILLLLLNRLVYAPGGFAIEVFPLTALPFSMAVPLVVTGFSLFSSYSSMRKLDPISIIEGKPTKKETGGIKLSAVSKRRASPPLSPYLFYLRHKSRIVLFVSVMALMISGTSSILLLFAAETDALKPTLNSYGKASVVTPGSGELDRRMVDSIRNNPLVERVIPVYDFSPFKISVPPMLPDHPVQACCVSDNDMRYLVELYRLRLAEGRLPSPGTNEIVLPWSVAKNRNIKVGTVIGDPDRPIYRNAPSLPIQLVVSGIFAPPSAQSEEVWLSFLSLDYVEPYRVSALSLMVVPVKGQKNVLDDWLEKNVAGGNRLVYTYRNQKEAFQKEMDNMLFTFSILEWILVLITVLVLTGLFYSYLVQRKTELGILSAIGFARKRLILSLLRENSVLVAFTWLAGIILCLIILFLFQIAIFDGIGLRLDPFQPGPWLSTLPIPVISLSASAFAVIWILMKLEPLEIIENRQ